MPGADNGKLRFEYNLRPEKVEVSGSGSPNFLDLTIEIHNPAGEHVNCNSIEFTLKVGDGADALTQPEKVNLIGTPESSRHRQWSLAKDPVYQGVFVAEPRRKTAGLGANETITFTIPHIEVSPKEGLANVEIVELYDSESSKSSRPIVKNTDTLTLTDTRAEPTVSPGQGDEVTLRWVATGVSKTDRHPTGVTLTETELTPRPGLVDRWLQDVEAEARNVSSPTTVRPQVSTIYTLKAYGSGVYKVAQVIVPVPSPRAQILFSVWPPSVDARAETFLTWAVANAEDCNLHDDAAGRTEPIPLTEGESLVKGRPQALENTTMFTLTAEGADEQPVQDQKTVTVRRLPKIIEFQGKRKTSSYCVWWKTDDATEVKLSFVGEVNLQRPKSDPLYLSWPPEHCYVLTASNANGEVTAKWYRWQF